MKTSSGLPSDSAELFPLLFCRLITIIWDQSNLAKNKYVLLICREYPGPSLRISSSLLRLSGSLWGLLEGVTLPPLLRLGPPWSSWEFNIETPQISFTFLLTVRDEMCANFCCLVMLGILYGKLWRGKPNVESIFHFSDILPICMHPLKNVLLLVFCAPWPEMMMMVVWICEKELNEKVDECWVLHYSQHSWDLS